MRKFTLTLEDAYNYLMTNTMDFQSLSVEDRLEKAVIYFNALKKLHKETNQDAVH